MFFCNNLGVHNARKKEVFSLELVELYGRTFVGLLYTILFYV